MTNVAQLMSRDISVIGEEASIAQAAQQMLANHIGSLLVERDGNYEGIITETDIVRAVAEGSTLVGVVVRDMMSSPIISVDHRYTPHLARDMMADRRIRHLAVTVDGAIAGVVSVRDLLAYFKTVSREIAS